MNEAGTIDAILRESRVIAVVGLSESPGRASSGVSRYMQQAGYRIVPVNPTIERALGEKAYATLDAAVEGLAADGLTIDLVDVFRASSFVPEIVKDVLRLKLAALWLQVGVCHEEAAGWAAAAGVRTVMDRCLMQEHAAWTREAGR